ncbi:MAG: M20 family metallopeptidase [Verrucomicrobiota bacterium]
MNQVADLLAKLVACPSVSPKYGTPIKPPYGEAGMVELLSELLRGWGGQVQIIETAPERPNILACFPGKNQKRSLLLDAHTDVVAVDGMIIPPFTPIIRDGKLYGRGASDTKGPMAAMLMGLRRVLDEDGQPPITVWFAGTCNEELGATGAAALMASGFRADIAVVAEPTSFQIVYTHKGALRAVLETAGVAAHSSMPHLGVNAIYKMLPVVARLEKTTFINTHPKLGAPTLSIGTITGGSQVNIVPASCRIEVDRRLLPGETHKEIVSQLVGNDDATCTVTEFYPPFEESLDSPVICLVADVSRRLLGRAEFIAPPYATNAGAYKAAGIPSVIFGPGHLAQAHTKDEYIELALVEQAVDLFAEIIRKADDYSCAK